MADDFLGSLIGNPVRARLLRALIFSQGEPLTLQQILKRSGTASCVAEREIRALEHLGLVCKAKGAPAPKKAWRVPKKEKGRRLKKAEVAWGFNVDFKYARALSVFVREISPVRYDRVLQTLKRAGKVRVILVSGIFMGDPSRPADLLVVGENLNDGRMGEAIRSLEPHFGREIRYAVLSTAEFRYRMTVQDKLVRETLDHPHLVLLDKTKLL